MIGRRRFCKGLLLGGLAVSFSGHAVETGNTPATPAPAGFGPLITDPRKNLDLPEGFSYQILSVAGMKMSDGLPVPGWPDGMHVFRKDDNRVAILCNHELDVVQQDLSAWKNGGDITAAVKAMSYDLIDGRPAPGAVRRIIYNMKTRQVEQQHLALCGTLRNCSGGATPWNTWISCEESDRLAGQSGLSKNHGYCFEVPAEGSGLARAEPIKPMGRFLHESAAVDPQTGIVYMTEDRIDGLFYRYIPLVRGQLSKGGRLQALVLKQGQSVSTSNRVDSRIVQGERMPVHWVDLSDVDSLDDSLRYQGQSSNAATFALGEGLFAEAGAGRTQHTTVWMSCSAGGATGLGQVFRYRPSKFEGQPGEKRLPGKLELFAEPNDAQLLEHGDNLTVMPNGDLLLCEDHYGVQRLVGINRQGKYYVLAANPRKGGEFAGPAFSPDGSTLFINLQQQGGTLAIRGPWNR